MDGQRLEERIAAADDEGAPPEAMTYRAAIAEALEWSRRQGEAFDRQDAHGREAPTVASVVREYLIERGMRSGSGKIAYSRMNNYVLQNEVFANIRLSALRASMIEAWRAGIPVRAETEERTTDKIAPSSLNRVLTDLRAALNAAAERYRRELPAHLPIEIKVGTRALPLTNVARKQIISEDEVRRLIEAAFSVDEDFGMLVLVSAATGARHSQIVALRVKDVQATRRRIMVPRSRKGRARLARAPIPVPLSPDVFSRLAPNISDRSPDEPLLTRWYYRHAGGVKWEKRERKPWGRAATVERFWTRTLAVAEMPRGIVMYALRHSSIVRGLTAGLPVRLVAALHDTSSEMIEKHYAAYIVDATEELTRRVALVA